MLHELERQGVLPASTGVDGLVIHLRERDLVIVCNAGQLTLDRHLTHDTMPETVGRPTLTPPPSAARACIPAQRGIQKTHHIHP